MKHFRDDTRAFRELVEIKKVSLLNYQGLPLNSSSNKGARNDTVDRKGWVGGLWVLGLTV